MSDFVSPGNGADFERDDFSAQLQALLDGPRHGFIDGVEFDLRHPDLPSSDDWHAPRGGKPFGIVFPWDRDFVQGDAKSAEKLVTDGASERGWSVVHVFRGDKVTLGRVLSRNRGAKARYGNPSDTHSLVGFLDIIRADGSVTMTDDQLFSWNARDAMGPASPWFYAGDDGLDDYVGDFRVSMDKVRRRLKSIAPKLTGEAREWILVASRVEDEITAGEEVAGSSVDLEFLLDMAVTLGYAVAKAEASPIMERVETRTKSASIARRKLSEPALEAARAFARANPETASLTRCARHVSVSLGRDQRQIERLLRPYFVRVTTGTGVRELRPGSWFVK